VAGGNQSAFGYRYQYLATIERFLRYMRDRLGQLSAIALHVEPTMLMSEGVARDDDIIDFAIELDSVIAERVQVKGLFANERAAVVGGYPRWGFVSLS
jgi:hypothetical protein